MAGKPDHAARLNRFSIALDAYIHGVGNISLDELRKDYDEIVSYEHSFMGNKLLRTRYLGAKQRAEDAFALSERIPAKQPKDMPSEPGKHNRAFGTKFNEIRGEGSLQELDLDAVEDRINTLNYLFQAFDLDNYQGQISASQFADAKAYRDRLLKRRDVLRKEENKPRDSLLKKVLNYDIRLSDIFRRGETHGKG